MIHLHPSQTTQLNHIRRRHQLKLILLHGSQVTDQTHPQSDLDIAVVSHHPNHPLDLLRLIHDLSAVFATNHLDLTDLTHANPLLLKTVTQKARLIAGSQKDFDTLHRLAFHRYADYLPYLNQEGQFVNQSLRP
jgi:predicted nucleotidyltransferase